MHEAALAQAALPAPTIVLGMLLRPYSLGHELFLIRENSPLVLGGEVGTRDLQEAVLICCQTWEEARGMHRDLFAGLKMLVWQWRTPGLLRYHFDKCLEGFRAYQAAGSLEFPPSETVQPGRGAGRLLGAPYLIRLHQFLIRELRLTEGEAWNYPFGLAKMQYHAHWEQEGTCDIKNAHEAEFERYCAEEDAKEEALKGGQRCRV